MMSLSCVLADYSAPKRRGQVYTHKQRRRSARAMRALRTKSQHIYRCSPLIGSPGGAVSDVSRLSLMSSRAGEVEGSAMLAPPRAAAGRVHAGDALVSELRGGLMNRTWGRERGRVAPAEKPDSQVPGDAAAVRDRRTHPIADFASALACMRRLTGAWVQTTQRTDRAHKVSTSDNRDGAPDGASLGRQPYMSSYWCRS